MPTKIIKNSDTIAKLRSLAGIDPDQGRPTFHQLELYKLAERIMRSGCQAMGTQAVCAACVRLEVPMCQQINGTIIPE